MLEVGLKTFRIEVGRYPSNEEGLSALRANPSIEHWEGPYVMRDETLSDEWDRPIHYEYPANTLQGYAIYSLGRDNLKDGSGADTDLGILEL